MNCSLLSNLQNSCSGHELVSIDPLCCYSKHGPGISMSYQAIPSNKPTIADALLAPHSRLFRWWLGLCCHYSTELHTIAERLYTLLMVTFVWSILIMWWEAKFAVFEWYELWKWATNQGQRCEMNRERMTINYNDCKERDISFEQEEQTIIYFTIWWVQSKGCQVSHGRGEYWYAPQFKV